MINLLGTFFVGLQLMFPLRYASLEPLTTDYDVLKALSHLAPLLISRSPVLVQ